jgi:hypothetical protein
MNYYFDMWFIVSAAVVINLSRFDRNTTTHTTTTQQQIKTHTQAAWLLHVSDRSAITSSFDFGFIDNGRKGTGNGNGKGKGKGKGKGRVKG